MNIALAYGRKKDDRRVTGFFALADERSRLETVHIRHFDVEKNHRHIVPEQVLQSLSAGRGLNEILIERAQDAFQREKVLTPVIDEQYVRFRLCLVSCLKRVQVHSIDGCALSRFEFGSLTSTDTFSTTITGGQHPPASKRNPTRRPRDISRGRPSTLLP